MTRKTSGKAELFQWAALVMIVEIPHTALNDSGADGKVLCAKLGVTHMREVLGQIRDFGADGATAAASCKRCETLDGGVGSARLKQGAAQLIEEG